MRAPPWYVLRPLALTLCLALLAGAEDKSAAPVPKGQRVFTCGHSFHVFVPAILADMAKKAGIDEDEVFRVAMAVREAAVNAVLHGNSYDPEKRITASFENTGESLVIRISDQGKGLDPDTLPDPLAPENLLRGSGRGIFLIRSFMDEVHFKQLHPGTELTLIKHLGTAQTGS